MDRLIRNLRVKARRDKPAVARAAHQERLSGGTMAGYGFGLAISIPAPPPISEYDAWLTTETTGASKMTGAKLRRAVIMTRHGHSRKEISTAIGLGVQAIGDWLSRLPEGLRP